MGSFDVLLDDERMQLDAFVEDYRSAIEATLVGLTEVQARRQLVASATTLLGLLKHVTWMQRVWFEECVGGTSRRELGLVQTPDESFRLADDDTVASVTAAHRRSCASWPTTAGTPTSCASRCSPTDRWGSSAAPVRVTVGVGRGGTRPDERRSAAAHRRVEQQRL